MKKLKKIFKKIYTTSILTNIILIAFGIFLLTKPDTTLKIISYTIGIVILLLGRFSFSKHLSEEARNISLNLVYSIICTILGLVLIINPTALATIIPFIIGFWIIINGVIKIQYAMQLKKNKKDRWIASLIVSIFILIWGLILVFNPFKGAVAITQLLGIFLIIYSVLDLIDSIIIYKNINDIGKSINKKRIKNKIIIEEE